MSGCRRARFALLVLVLSAPSIRAADPPRRKPLDPGQRATLLLLVNAVDAAQGRDDDRDAAMAWEHHMLKAGNQTAYLPFRLTLNTAADTFKSAALYIRAVSRHGGFRTTEERSALRDWLVRGGDAPPPRTETVVVGPGEMPVGGPASTSTRRTTQAIAEASTLLSLQQREYEKQKAAEEAAKKRAETRERDPYLFPFEDYHFVDLKSRGSDPREVERAFALPPGEYDVYIAIVDRARAKTSTPSISRRTLTVPDYWNDRLAISSLMLVSGVNTLKTPLPAAQQTERPYTFGLAEVVPVRSRVYGAEDVLTVVLQICNYGAPDADLTVDYSFFHDVGGTRRLFNRTPPQHLVDEDLPSPSPWETQAFTSQSVPLHAFPAGRYELEVSVRDRLTRDSTKQTIAFTVR